MYDIYSCDLLSKMYLCRIGNNMMKEYIEVGGVVICFQKCIFVVLETTTDSELDIYAVL